MNCFRYFGFTSFEQVNRLTIPEYRILQKAIELREVDKDYRNHLQAFLNFKVKATKRAGKGKERPVYSVFKKFYDYHRELSKVCDREKKEDRFAEVKEVIRRRER